jgi:hypothetical protein
MNNSDFSTKPDFNTMSRSELWHYVVKHRQDDEAFNALMDLVHASPKVKIETMEHLARLIEERDRLKRESPQD